MPPKSTSNRIKLPSYKEKTLMCRHYPALPYLPAKLASTCSAMLTPNMSTYPLHSSTLHYKVNLPPVCSPFCLRFRHHTSSIHRHTSPISPPRRPIHFLSTRQNATEALWEETENGGPVYPYMFGCYFLASC